MPLAIVITAQEVILPPLDPEKTVVAFDFHGVIVDTDYSKMYQLLDSNFAKNFAYAMPRVILQAPWWIHSIMGLLKIYPKSAIFSKLAQEYTFFKPLVPTITRMTNQQKLKPGIEQILESLKSANYTLALASNITDDTLQDLDQNGPQEVKALLDKYFPNQNRLIPSAENNMLHKPSTAYFETLKAKFPEKKILFFDDKKVNRDKALMYNIFAFDPIRIPAITGTLLQNASAAPIESV
jgi:FMN phosphatase YigB (HAD superfamily)